MSIQYYAGPFCAAALGFFWASTAIANPPRHEPIDVHVTGGNINVDNFPTNQDVTITNDASSAVPVDVQNSVGVDVLTLPGAEGNAIDYDDYLIDAVFMFTSRESVLQEVDATLFKVDIEHDDSLQNGCVFTLIWTKDAPPDVEDRGIRVLRETITSSGPFGSSTSFVLPRPLAVKTGQYLTLDFFPNCRGRVGVLHYETN